MLEADGFNSSPLDDDSAFDHILGFLTDLGYHTPPIPCAMGWVGKAYLFHSSELNHGEG